MGLPGLNCTFERLPAPVPIHHALVTRKQWRSAVSLVRGLGGRLVALWGSDRGGVQSGAEGQPGPPQRGYAVAAAYAVADGLAWVELPVSDQMPIYPGIADVFPAATRMQRTVGDLLGLVAEEQTDARRWLRHGAWPYDYHPLQRHNTGRETFAAAADDYPFVTVEGDGVHEIAVGPVHAGIIEPGHFRFSVVGEKVLRLEQRLGYAHKGIEKRFEGMHVDDGARLAARVSGDSTVAYGWAYCMAAESARRVAPPARAQWLRALALERERVANHLGDLGALGNDAAFAFGLAQFSRLKEDWLRTNLDLFGHRYLMDWIVPGGVAGDLPVTALARIAHEAETLARSVNELRAIYDEHAGLQDRFVGAGRVTPDLARRLGLTGLAGRASGQAADLRADFPQPPYDVLKPRVAASVWGDVAARVAVRFDETIESLRLIRDIASALPPGRVHAGPETADGGAAVAESSALGWIEGWRGEVLVALELGADGRVRRCHCHDPSWQNWPVLEHAVIGNIVPDFPLINKSFNLSYSGHDL